MLTQAELTRLFFALTLATLLARRGYRSQSLSSSGAAAAFLVGFLSWAASSRFGATLITFYLSSTRATRYRAAQKRLLEDGFSTAAGNRSAAQVFASSLPAVVLAVGYYALYRFDSPVSPKLSGRSVLLLAYLLFFAACAGDTFSSEIGLVLPRRGSDPVLITAPWRRVPRGTNGGVSWQGTVASGVGGVVVGSVYFLTGPEWTFSQLWLLVVGMLGGVFGSAFDSIVGAIAQASWLDTASGKVLKNTPPLEERKGAMYQHICGVDVLSGEAVNAVAAMATATLAPLLLPLFAVSYPAGA